MARVIRMLKRALITSIAITSFTANASWNVSSDVDEMTGEATHYAISQSTESINKMDFPYKDVRSWIGVGCDKKIEFIFIGFNKSPNITNDKNQDGWSLISTRFEWDNDVESVKLSQTWGSKFLQFRGDDSKFIKKIESKKNGLLYLSWHGQGSVYFPYSFEGSSKAIATIRQKCK